MSAGPRFGTAGLRAAMGPGPGEFNTGLVARASHGLAMYLLQRQIVGPVLIGYDARHGSADFARVAAGVFGGAGLKVAILPRPLPTPVLAFAVRHLGAAAGVMITASHNPATDNGYKVYLADGAQVAPPQDAAIEDIMADAPPAAEFPRADTATGLGDEVLETYLARALSLLEPGGARTLRVAYTPLHGVAGATFRRAWALAGFEPFVEVAEQAEPDPDFPTVAFPNPEEPGALDLAGALALRTGADLVLAHDPDGDRCAVMVPTLDGFRKLTGDEVGALLAEHLFARGRIPAGGVLATTIVSSPLLARIAAAHGHECVETLTGFKWLARVPRLAYAYEEALGYCVDPEAVRDKDGITAALLIAELAAGARADGRTLIDELDSLARRYGVHVTAARSIRTADPNAGAAVLADLLANPPTSLAGRRVDSVQDMQAPVDGQHPTAGVRLMAGGLRAILRPSGTEPKLKLYLHAALDPPQPDLPPLDLHGARAALQVLLQEAGEQLVRAVARGSS